MSCLVIYEKRTVSRKAPNTIELTVHEEFLKNKNYELPSKYLTCVSRARLIGDEGFLILPDGSYVLEVAWLEFLLTKHPAYFQRMRPRLRKQQGNYYSLMLFWGRGYYHWLHDVLERLHLVIELLPEDIKYIVPTGLALYEYESLRALGIRDDQLRYFDGSEFWELENLYFSPPSALTGFDSAEANVWLRERILNKYEVKTKTGKGDRRIFISRKLADRGRRIVNEKEAEEVLNRYGFETFALEKMSLREQVILFSQAEIIVSPSGAGLTNVLFAPRGTRILEIFEPSKNNVRAIFWSLSEALGHDYWYLLGQTKAHFPEPDIFVRADKLEESLKKIMGRDPENV
jgi:capsular polysaccharide biosynthesis protein